MENPTGHQDLRQSPTYAKYITTIGWKVVGVQGLGSRVQIFIRPLGILGAIAKIQRANLPLPWDKIQTILKKHRVWMTKLEPANYDLRFKNYGFKQDKWPLLATKTQRISLSQSLSEIERQFKKDCRYSLRRLSTQHLALSTNDFDGFYGLWKKAAKIKRLWIPSRKHFDSLIQAFGDNCFCVTIDNLAGAVVLVHDKTAYYYYAASLPEGKKRLLPYSSVWELIQGAKRRGCTVWDWEGIYDSRWPNKSWQGFSHFKKSFGGYEVSFPGSFTKWF